MEATVLAIQQFYPQVFHACHVAHTRARSNAFRLSERDSAILAHVLPDWPVTARELARHLGIGAPAMSAAVQRLERLGYLARGPRSRSSPARPLRLTETGARALQSASVLDTGRLTELLATLSAPERGAAVRGLQLLAKGARAMAQRWECS
jgi:DNA-binding MarR family transcriptional regulator